METEQSSINQTQTDAETRSQQTSANNSRLFTFVVISVLLTAMVAGSAVYFWQKAANKKVVTRLEQKIISLEKQLATMKRAAINPQPALPPKPSSLANDPTANWKRYISPNGWQIKYPSDTYLRLICPNEELALIAKDPLDDRTDPIEMSTCARDGRYALEGKTYDTIQDSPQETKYYQVEHTQVVLDGIKADQYTFTFTNIGEVHSPKWYTLVHLNRYGKTIEFYFDNKANLNIFNQILSTFKFTN